MDVKNSDLFDRYSILRIKYHKTQDPGVKADLLAHMEAADKAAATVPIERFPEFSRHIMALGIANAMIWGLEAGIRNGETLPEDEVGRRALQIRDWNRVRCNAKDGIAGIFGEHKDPKVEHRSQQFDMFAK